jgi:hypothetical protein
MAINFGFKKIYVAFQDCSERYATFAQISKAIFYDVYAELCQHHLYRADLHQMVSHRPIECTPLIRTQRRRFTGNVAPGIDVRDHCSRRNLTLQFGSFRN